MSEEIEVSALNLETRLATFTDGTSGRITDMFDLDGEDTHDPDETVAVIVEHKKTGRWFVRIPEDFEAGILQ